MENLALVSLFTTYCLFFRVLAYFSVPLPLVGFILNKPLPDQV
jgi:hypothetical protein